MLCNSYSLLLHIPVFLNQTSDASSGDFFRYMYDVFVDLLKTQGSLCIQLETI